MSGLQSSSSSPRSPVFRMESNRSTIILLLSPSISAPPVFMIVRLLQIWSYYREYGRGCQEAVRQLAAARTGPSHPAQSDSGREGSVHRERLPRHHARVGGRRGGRPASDPLPALQVEAGAVVSDPGHVLR